MVEDDDEDGDEDFASFLAALDLSVVFDESDSLSFLGVSDEGASWPSFGLRA